ncbi:MAG: preprotein translocase subunit SecA [Patescibacteria group bacterium]|jgi:preprotein translocase subunit SecA|nr:preprotein translocase subunit SecA [Patescibacteria group bacterium]
MLFNLFKKDLAQSFYKKNLKIIEAINRLEPEFEKLSDFTLREKSLELQKQVKSKEDLDEILVPAFALAREAAKRTLKQRHYDVQLLGGLALHQGKIAEMKTGEGKTLAATLPAYLNALLKKGVHIVTVNDYLAKRDTVWMGQIYYALGLSVGCIVHEQAYIYDPDYKASETEGNQKQLDQKRDATGGFKVFYEFLRPVSRKEAYDADITYGTNHEFGFDYLRDNLVLDLNQKVQRGHYYAIIDEVDSILIDEARTPLIITIPDYEASDFYKLFARIVPQLIPGEDYQVDEKLKSALILDSGVAKVEKILKVENLYSPENFRYVHYLEESLKAYALFKRDKDYIVKDGEVIIVDEFTGRLLFGRRYSGGLHQAIEAKEGVEVKQENRILASITFQNYFRMYEKLAGMTGTALTSAEEFDKVYGLIVQPIPTNKPMIRVDLPDLVFKTQEEKWNAIVAEIKKRHQIGQPLLIGTVSIENNEKLSAMLSREGIPHNVLNAKNHEREGEIIAQAGKLGAVTVATNMAGRGVDIILGGNPSDPIEAQKIKELGGLHVIGTERHEARRIDNQLRGRAGRQGDPGSSQFFVSLEDDLMRIFGGERIKSLMNTLNYPYGIPIQAGIVNRAIESAQTRIEGLNFDARKYTLEFDDVLNKQRKTFYEYRDKILKLVQDKKLLDEVEKIIEKNIQTFLGIPIENLETFLKKLQIIEDQQDLKEIPQNNLYNFLLEKTQNKFWKLKEQIEGDLLNEILKSVILSVLDNLWTQHLENLEYLRDVVRLRAYGQHDPLVEYKMNAHRLFKDFFVQFEGMLFEIIFQLKKPQLAINQNPLPANVSAEKFKNVGRNDPCPCGSGKKFKKCHGA